MSAALSDTARIALLLVFLLAHTRAQSWPGVRRIVYGCCFELMKVIRLEYETGARGEVSGIMSERELLLPWW